VIVDVHAHLFPRSAVLAANDNIPWYGAPTSVRPDGSVAVTTGSATVTVTSPLHLEPLERRIERMDALGIDVQVVSLLPPFFRYDIETAAAVGAARAVNDELAEMVASQPARFRGLATLPLQDSESAVAELERAIDDLGLSGVAIGTHVSGHDLNAPEFAPVFEAAAGLGAFVFVHSVAPRVGPALEPFYLGNLIGNPLEVTIAAASLIFGGVLDRHPKLIVCLAHAGGYAALAAGRLDRGHAVRPECATPLAAPSSYLQRLYVDCLTHDPAALRFLLDSFGPAHVVLGSDYPGDMGLDDPVGFVSTAIGLTDDERSAVLGGTAERLLGLE
jgi:aminocarboxymuconate-semialdehyde decarboxylase